MVGELPRLQAEIDAIDDAIVEMLAQRFQRSRRIGVIKRETGLPPTNPRRIAQQKQRFCEECVLQGLDGVMAFTLISTLIGQVVAERAT